jgi:protoporphyrinogen IX oxidase
MLWIKALHIVFIVSWMSGLFYLPRIFVNLAMETPGPTTERLLTMARKLYRFTTMLALPAVVFGIWLVWDMWLQYGAKMPGWLHAKLFVVFLLLGYHHACGALLKKFERGANARGHVFYRWFNEVPVLMLLAIVILVVVKPF